MLKNKNYKNHLMVSKQISRDLILKIHKYSLKCRQKENMGQRALAKKINNRFGVKISESTISGWIHKSLVPFDNERTQFKAKPIPKKDELQKLYVNNFLSASDIADKKKVTTVTVIKWLKLYGISPRTHRNSMNTIVIKKKLRKVKLKRPTKKYHRMSPEKAYIFGVLCGDAYINKKVIKLEIKQDIEFIEEFSQSLEKVYGIKYKHYYYKKRNSYILIASSQIITKDLLKHGNFRTFSWEVPKEIENTKKEHIVASFLRGLYDSDGSISSYYINLTTASKAGAISTKKMLAKIGIKSALRPSHSKYYTIYISRKENLKLFKDKIGFTIIRKMAKLRNTYRKGW